MKALALLIGILIAQAAYPQSAAEMVQKVINDAGMRCDAVANIRPGAGVDNGDALLIADCSDGSSHVVRYSKDGELSYVLDCASGLSPIDCGT